MSKEKEKEEVTKEPSKFDKLKDKFSEDDVDLLYFNPYNFLYK